MSQICNVPSMTQLIAQCRALAQCHEDGEIDEETYKDTFEAVEGEFEAKADAIAYVISEINGEIAMRKEEIKRLQGKNEVANNSIERLKKLLWESMEAFEKPKFKTAFHSFNIANNGGVKPLVFAGGQANLDAIDDRFIKVKTERSVDGEAVREALDAGEDLGFVWYGERGKRLDIR